MKRSRTILGILVVTGLLLAGCQAATQAIPDTVSTATPQLTQTATPTPTSRPPTATPTPTPIPPTPTPTPIVEPGAILGPDTITGLMQLGQIGRGEIGQGVWAPDGAQMALATGLGVYLFDGATLELREHLPTGYTHHAAYSPDGTTLGLAGEHWYGLWDLETGAFRFQQTTPYDVEALAFNPDGTALMIAAAEGVPVRVTYGTITRFDVHVQQYAVTNGARLRAIKLVDPDGRALIPRFTDGGTVVETISPPATTIWWDAQTGQQLYAHKGGDFGMTTVRGVRGRAFVLNYTSPSTVVVIDLATGSNVGTLRPGGTVYGILTGDDTVTLLTDHVTQWEVATLEQVADIDLGSAGKPVLALSPGLDRAVTQDDDLLRLLDTDGGALLGEQAGFYDRAWQVAISADTRLLAVNRGTHYGQNLRVETWDIAQLARLAIMNPGQRNAFAGLAFDADGELLTGIMEQSHLQTWDPWTGNKADEFDVGRGVMSFALTQAGSQLAVGHTVDATLWDVAGGTLLAEMGDWGGGVSRISISEDGSRATLQYGGSNSLLWDVNQERASLSSSDCAPATISPDGTRFACELKNPYAEGPNLEGTVVTRDAATGAELSTLTLPASVIHMAYTPDSRLLAVSCEDGALYLWDADGVELLHRLETPARHFAFSADGRLLVTTASEGTVRIWGSE